MHVPARLIMRVGDDDELRVGNDGRPLLLPYLLKKIQATHEVDKHFYAHTLW